MRMLRKVVKEDIQDLGLVLITDFRIQVLDKCFQESKRKSRHDPYYTVSATAAIPP